jgi:hypothetical protein
MIVSANGWNGRDEGAGRGSPAGKAESNGNEQGQDELPHPNQRKVRIDGIRTKASADAVVFG